MKLFCELLDHVLHSLIIKHRFGNITIYKGFPQNEDFKFVPFSDKSQAGKKEKKKKKKDWFRSLPPRSSNQAQYTDVQRQNKSNYQ